MSGQLCTISARPLIQDSNLLIKRSINPSLTSTTVLKLKKQWCTLFADECASHSMLESYFLC